MTMLMKWIEFIIVLTIIGISILSMDNHLTVRTYIQTTDKVDKNVRIALITDLHNCLYGEKQKELLATLSGQEPDVVFFVGDIADDNGPIENMISLIAEAAKEYDCFYVTGNHECRRGDFDLINSKLKLYGIKILEGECFHLRVNEQNINLCGVDDFDIGEDVFEKQLKKAISEIEPGKYTILMSHHPEQISRYLKYDFDLILSGHTHGGQWRIPGILNGLVAPDQGIFPKYGGGKYEFEDTTMIISRGLARDYGCIPRIFNPPEIVIVDLVADHE